MIASTLSAQGRPEYTLPIEIKGSPREQIERGKEYMNQALNAQDADEQFRLAGLAVGHLIAVGKMWPDRIANLNANLLIADLGIALKYFTNVENALDEARSQGGPGLSVVDGLQKELDDLIRELETGSH